MSPAVNSAPQPALVLERVLRVLAPLVRLLVRHGIGYPAFAAALKRVFLDAARAELAARGMTQTDSAVTLLSGVHRRDVRELTRGERAAAPAAPPLGLAGEVVARWLAERDFRDRRGAPRVLPRSADAAAGSFDALVQGISSDVRPRAVLDELLRLGVVEEDGRGVHLRQGGFAPRADFAQLSDLFARNLHDHAAAAAANLQGEADFLEQAVYVDHITEASAARLQQAAQRAWQQALRSVMAEAQARFDHDEAQAAPAERTQRARFGVYFFKTREDASP